MQDREIYLLKGRFGDIVQHGDTPWRGEIGC
jgi:hypothetical protein